MRRARRRGRKTRNTAALKLMVVLLVLALGGVGAMAVYAYNSYMNNNKMMQAVVNTDKIYKNIYINGVNVGGMTREAAELLLRKEFIPPLQENTVTVTAGEAAREFSFGEFSARYDFSEAVEQAYQYAKQGTLEERYALVTALDEKPYDIQYDPVYAYDGENIADMLGPLRDEVNIEPLNASITRKNGQFILSDSQIGRVLNTEVTVGMITGVLDTEESGEVAAVVDEIRPEYDASDLADVQSLIGTFSTKIAGGATDRNQNVTNALSKINDVVLAPGEVFSTNGHFGAMTYDNGYRDAPVIVGGQLEQGMGGGVCQVSSTLYNAVLLAELEIVERMNHSLKVAYVDYGFDATLAGDYIDFKFKNDTDAPVFLEAVLLNGTDVTINIYGKETHSPGRSLQFSNELVETVPPPDVPVETEDPGLAPGERVVKQKPVTGYRYRVYKTVFENGLEVEKVTVNTSYYRPARGETLVGAGAAAGTDPAEAQAVTDGTAAQAPPASVPVSDEYIDFEGGYDPAPIQPGDMPADLFPPASPVPAPDLTLPAPTPMPEFSPLPVLPAETPAPSFPAYSDTPPVITEPAG